MSITCTVLKNDSVEEKRRLILARAEMLKATGKKLPPLTKKVPKQASTIPLEVDYFADIMSLLYPLYDEVRGQVIPRLGDIVSSYKEQTRTDDSYAELITSTFGNVKLAVHQRITEEHARETAQEHAEKVSGFHRTQLNRQFISVLGINPLLTEPYLEAQVKAFVEANVSLIQSIPAQFFQRVETKVRATVEQGLSTKQLADQIQSEFQITRNRARLIARDQIGKYYGKLNELRQQETGITHYIWATSDDERVRKSHDAIDGKRFSWKNPPAVGSRGERYHPGFDFQCRCQALPDFSVFREALGHTKPEPAAKAKPTTKNTGEFVPAKTVAEVQERLYNLTEPSPDYRANFQQKASFGRQPIDKQNSLLRGLEEILNQYDTKVNELGLFSAKHGAGRFTWDLRYGSTAIKFERQFLENYKEVVATNKRLFEKKKARMIANLQEWLKDPNRSEETKVLIREKLERYKKKKRNFSYDDADDPLQAVAVHEAYHAVSHKYRLDRVFNEQLKAHKVEFDLWRLVSDYAGTDQDELFAEVGAALHFGLDVPAPIKKAFLATVKTVKGTK